MLSSFFRGEDGDDVPASEEHQKMLEVLKKLKRDPKESLSTFNRCGHGHDAGIREWKCCCAWLVCEPMLFTCCRFHVILLSFCRPAAVLFGRSVLKNTKSRAHHTRIQGIRHLFNPPAPLPPPSRVDMTMADEVARSARRGASPCRLPPRLRASLFHHAPHVRRLRFFFQAKRRRRSATNI